jgi:hypothetical protein
MFGTFPNWLHTLAIASLAVGAACAISIALDEIRRPQKMWIMNLVWPLTALFGSVFWTAGYYAWGRARPGKQDDDRKPAFPIMVAKGASHCGAGCTLGDIIVEWAAFAIPTIAVWFGWHSLFAEKTFAVWIPDFIVAFAIGIFFQYFTIAPMRGLGPGEGIVAAVKADIASISAWQIGMYGLMAAIQFGWYERAFGGIAEVNSPEFWFAMQLSMLAGFCTAYPVNWMLIRAGLKEKM